MDQGEGVQEKRGRLYSKGRVRYTAGAGVGVLQGRVYRKGRGRCTVGEDVQEGQGSGTAGGCVGG